MAGGWAGCCGQRVLVRCPVCVCERGCVGHHDDEGGGGHGLTVASRRLIRLIITGSSSLDGTRTDHTGRSDNMADLPSREPAATVAESWFPRLPDVSDGIMSQGGAGQADTV